MHPESFFFNLSTQNKFLNLLFEAENHYEAKNYYYTLTKWI